MEVDPEALIKCTTITSGGVASSTPAVQGEKVLLLTFIINLCNRLVESIQRNVLINTMIEYRLK